MAPTTLVLIMRLASAIAIHQRQSMVHPIARCDSPSSLVLPTILGAATFDHAVAWFAQNRPTNVSQKPMRHLTQPCKTTRLTRTVRPTWASASLAEPSASVALATRRTGKL